MEEGDSVVGGLDKTRTGAESQSVEQTVETVAVEVPKMVDKCEPIQEVDDLQLVGVPVEVAVDSVVGGEEVPSTVVVEVKMEEKIGEMMDLKRKRGRPPRGQIKPPPSKRNKEEEEDVCFICFDGGSLVLCDRKSCPKAYHPACIKRDEAFFRSKAKWNCGWHICSICLKASHYMCYTCTYSLCKGCTKNSEYVCVRGNKGFCTACMKTVMLIENNEQGNKEMIQVDFDDKSSWEYLFKVYWIYLKGKLSLTLNELTQAKNPWKGAGAMACKRQSADIHYGISDGKISVSNKSFGTLEAKNSKRKKSNEQPELLNKCALNTEKPGNVGNVIPAGVVGNVASQGKADGNTESSTMTDEDKTCTTRIKGEERAPQTNPDEYAAIDVHNINLIYLRSNLMECLIEDNEKFHDKVVGSMVRIRVSGSDQKQDMHRLVQVVGTSKVAIPYKIGDKTTDVMLEVFNLVKKEVISIDAISNQEFSEDECRRLRQSIRCGLIKRLTVGEVQVKAMALQALRLNDWLETETLRLNHLRDRASEKGHKNELQECIEKLQLLKAPEERLRRLREIPEVHSDPKMDPNFDSEEDAGELTDKKQDKCVRPRNSGLSKNGGRPISPRKRFEISNDTGSRSWKSSTTCERSNNLNVAFYPVEEEGSTRTLERVNEVKDECGLDSSIKPGNQVDSTGSASGEWNNQAVLGSGLFSASETSITPLTTGSTSSANISEADELWHYRDPNGKVQGPFSIVQLQKWSTTGLFPQDMRIWTSDEHDGSFLLTDALNGKFHKVSPLFHSSLHSQEVDVRWSDSMNAIGGDNKKGDGVSHSSSPNPPVNCDEAQTGSCSQHWDLNKANSSSPDQSQMHSTLPSSTVSGQPHVALLHQRIGHEGESCNSDPNHKNWSSQGISGNEITGALSQENQSSTRGYLGQSCGQNWKSFPVTFSSNNLDSTSAFASFKRSTDSSGQNGNMNSSDLPNPTPKSGNIDLERAAENKQSLSSDVPVRDSDILDRRSPTPKPIDEDLKRKAAENKQPVHSNFPVQDSGPSWSSASSIVVGRAVPEIADEFGYSPNPAKASVEEWDSGLVSSLKPPELVSDHVATPTSNNDQLTHSSPSHPAFNLFSWQPIEFSTLAEESVSDLLAEVDAMESQSGLPSPTSRMRCGEELIQDSKNECFSSIEELSPTFDPGKSDALSSTGDIQLPCQSARADEQVGASQADVFDPTHRSSIPSSTTAEMQRERKSTAIPVSQDIVDTSITLRSGSEAMDNGWGTMQGNGNLGWGGSAQGIVNTSWGIGQRIARGTVNMNRGPITDSRDGGFHGVDSEFSRGRSPWSRQSLGSAGGGGYSKPPPSKGKQICEFYGSGHCMKGAFCEYLHP